jgi:hypothetical protein
MIFLKVLEVGAPTPIAAGAPALAEY